MLFCNSNIAVPLNMPGIVVRGIEIVKQNKEIGDVEEGVESLAM